MVLAIPLFELNYIHVSKLESHINLFIKATTSFPDGRVSRLQLLSPCGISSGVPFNSVSTPFLCVSASVNSQACVAAGDTDFKHLRSFPRKPSGRTCGWKSGRWERG